MINETMIDQPNEQQTAQNKTERNDEAKTTTSIDNDTRIRIGVCNVRPGAPRRASSSRAAPAAVARLGGGLPEGFEFD
jgi:hypothetical protein